MESEAQSWALLLIGYAELACAAVFFSLSFSAVLLVISRKTLIFNRLWAGRLLLSTLSVLWGVAWILGLRFLWSKDHGLVGLDPSLQEILCSAHVFIAYGISEPGFFLCLFLIIGTVITFHSRAKKQEKKMKFASSEGGLPVHEKTNGLWISFSSLLHSHNRSIISKCLVSLLPLVFIMSLVVASHHIFVPASSQFTYEVYTEDKQQCMAPLIAIAAALCYLVVIMLLFYWKAKTLSSMLVNLRLIRRIQIAYRLVGVLLPVGMLFRIGCLFLRDDEDLYQVANFIGSVILGFLLFRCLWIFVVNPIREAQQAAADSEKGAAPAKRSADRSSCGRENVFSSGKSGKNGERGSSGMTDSADSTREITGIDTIMHDVESGIVHTHASPAGKLEKYAAKDDEFEEEEEEFVDATIESGMGDTDRKKLIHGSGPLTIGGGKEEDELDWGDDDDDL